MKASNADLLVFAFTIAVGCGVFSIAQSGLFPSSEKVHAMNSQFADGMPEGLHKNETILQFWESGLYPYDDTSFIFWLDNSTLLFEADKYPKPVTLKDGPKRTPWLYLWQLGEKPQPHGEDPYQASRFYRAARGNLCFQQMKIDPATGQASEVLMLGPSGQEREASPWNKKVPGRPLNGIPGIIEAVDCKQIVDPKMAGRVYSTDSYGYFYLDRTAFQTLPPAAGENPILMKSDGTDRKVLPVPPEEVDYVYYRTFDNFFWTLESSIGRGPRVRGGPIIDSNEKWQATNCLAIWQIDPTSGSTARTCIPFGPWSGQTADAARSPAQINLVPTAKGLFFSSTNYTDSKDPKYVGASGLYKLENSAVRRVLTGYINYPSVSPDGCRVAFVYGPNWVSHEWGTPGSWTIAAIDLCPSRTQ